MSDPFEYLLFIIYVLFIKNTKFIIIYSIFFIFIKKIGLLKYFIVMNIQNSKNIFVTYYVNN